MTVKRSRTGSDKTWIFEESSKKVHTTSVEWIRNNLAGVDQRDRQSNENDFGKPFEIFEPEGDTILFMFLNIIL